MIEHRCSQFLFCQKINSPFGLFILDLTRRMGGATVSLTSPCIHCMLVLTTHLATVPVLSPWWRWKQTRMTTFSRFTHFIVTFFMYYLSSESQGCVVFPFSFVPAQAHLCCCDGLSVKADLSLKEAEQTPSVECFVHSTARDVEQNLKSVSIAYFTAGSIFYSLYACQLMLIKVLLSMRST